MIGASLSRRVYAYGAPVDMRKGHDGLSAIVREGLGRDPLSGDLYLFVSRNRIRAKVLLWDGTGLCVYAKRLEKGRFARLWRAQAGEVLELSSSELQLFHARRVPPLERETTRPSVGLGGRSRVPPPVGKSQIVTTYGVGATRHSPRRGLYVPLPRSYTSGLVYGADLAARCRGPGGLQVGADAERRRAYLPPQRHGYVRLGGRVFDGRGERETSPQRGDESRSGHRKDHVEGDWRGSRPTAPHA